MDARKPPTDPAPRRKLIRRQEVGGIVGVSRSTIYAWVSQGRFPQPVKVGPHAARWYLDELMEFINSRPRSRLG